MSIKDRIFGTKKVPETFSDAHAPDTVRAALNDAYQTMRDNDYDPEGQLAGYLLTGDDAYLTAKNDVRARLTEYKRHEIVLELLRAYFRKKK